MTTPTLSRHTQVVSLRNDTFHVVFTYFPHSDAVSRAVAIISPERIEEAKTFGMPQQWSEVLAPYRAQAQIVELLATGFTLAEAEK